jgi:minor extracellular serine protease Vpr
MLVPRKTCAEAGHPQSLGAGRTPRALFLLLLMTLLLALTVSGLPRRSQTTGARSQSNRFRMGKEVSITFNNPAAQNVSPADVFDFREMLSAPGGGRAPTKKAVIRQRTTVYKAFNLEFDSSAACESFALRFKEADAAVFNRFERFADIFIPGTPQGEQIFANVQKAAGLRWLEMVGVAQVPPPPRRTASGAKSRGSEPIVQGGLEGLTGKGVIIAVIDSGVDFRNPDFITYGADGKATSRLLYLWDTTSNAYEARRIGGKAPISYPNQVSVGTLYNREQLTEELRIGKYQIPATDANGHGTACAGLAAGNGNNAKGEARKSNFMGVAPEADIIAVRIGGTATGSLENGYLIGAISNWLDKVAGTTPLVLSCSFGHHRGGHDGALIEERQLDARFTPDRVGRALVIAAGNEATTPRHAEVKFKNQNEPGSVGFKIGETGGRLTVYFNNREINDLEIVAAKGTSIKFAGGEVNPFTEQAVAYIYAAPGAGTIYLFNKSGKAMKADVYISGGLFNKDSAKSGVMVGSPGTAKNAITVGSYDFNDQFPAATGIRNLGAICPSERPVALTIGGISCYSSPGYRRDGTVKPDIVAPGQYHLASYARLPATRKGAPGRGVLAGNPTIELDKSGNYWLFCGTSAATPHAAGIIALMMQKKPAIKLSEIKTLLHKQASNDETLTGRTPNPQYGYGKLDRRAAERILSVMK